MAVNTDKSLRRQVMYSVYVRNYSKEGTFAKVQEDLPRIKALGVDIIWLMPIHPVGVKNRKGDLGSPYAIRDYRAVNPEFGTLEDFKALVNAIHAQGMKCIIDVVYNHTSPDSWLAEHHPEWFYHKPDGSFGNRVGEWWDVIDLDYDQRGLWDYQIETLRMWAEIVDGFRCDVAPLVPLAFWLEARAKVAEVNPDCLWLSESVEPEFIRFLRSQGMTASSDCEIYQAFDLAYDYDIHGYFIRVLTGEGTLAAYLDKVNAQECTYPANYVKLRHLENHDRPRAAAVIPDEGALRSWTAFQYFQKGMPLIYNGQECCNTVRPSLFDKDDVDWQTGRDLSPLMRRLYDIRQDDIFTDSAYSVQALGHDDVIFAQHRHGDDRLVGLFPIKGQPCVVHADVPDGRHVNLIDGTVVVAEQGLVSLSGASVIIDLR